jgi:clumping factor A
MKANFLKFIIPISLIALIILGIIPCMASALDWHSYLGHSHHSHFRNSHHPFSGNSNTGDSNTGDSNTGNSNTGNSESGNTDTENSNTENSQVLNSSTEKSSDINSGNENSGIVNSIEMNSDDANSSYFNSSDVDSSSINSSIENNSNVNSSDVDSSSLNPNTVNSSAVDSSAVNSSTSSIVDSSTVDSSTSSVVDSSSGESRESQSSSSSSSNSGTGLFYREPATNVLAKELTSRNIANDNHIKYDFTENNTCITYIEFDALRTFQKTTTVVEELKNKSIFVSKNPVGRIYKYVNIWVGNKGAGLPTSLKNGIVAFKVEKSWINNSNVNESLITLQWYNNSWETLYTEKVGKDDNYAYFESKTPGFSLFAITEYKVELDKNGTDGSRKVDINGSLNNSRDSRGEQARGASKILMAIFLPLTLAGYFVVRKKI